MKPETLDEKTEWEFKFSFEQINFWTIHDLFRTMRCVQGEVTPVNEIELINEKGETWNINSRDEMKLFRLFNKPNTEYTAVVKGTKGEFMRYKYTFERYSNYKKYFLAGLEEDDK
jgi:hypothetical protein